MESVIKDVELQELAVIPTNGGPVMHMMRPASPLFGEIGEVYFSEVEPGCVKAWKCHTRQTQRFAVPVGRLKIVLYDGRPDSPTHRSRRPPLPPVPRPIRTLPPLPRSRGTTDRVPTRSPP